jgi:hypothetical protein
VPGGRPVELSDGHLDERLDGLPVADVALHGERFAAVVGVVDPRGHGVDPLLGAREE